MRMPFKQEPPSRIERIRCGVQSRTADAAQAASQAARYTADRTRPMAADAAAAAQAAAGSAAALVSEAAASAAQSVADAATTAAQSVAARARPLAGEAASRGSAAWAILRYGAPAPSPLKRVVMVPSAAVGKVGDAMKTKRGSAVGLMALGGVAAGFVMYWRKSRTGTDSVWILDEPDDDLQPPEGWHEGSSRMSSSARAGERESAADRLADRASGLTDSEHGRKRPDTWP